MDRKIRLPKEGFIDGTDADGQGVSPTDMDVEGHVRGNPEDFTVLPAPPGLRLDRSPHGGELRDSSDDAR